MCPGAGGSGDGCQGDGGRADGRPERVAVVWVTGGAQAKADGRPRTVAGATGPLTVTRATGRRRPPPPRPQAGGSRSLGLGGGLMRRLGSVLAREPIGTRGSAGARLPQPEPIRARLSPGRGLGARNPSSGRRDSEVSAGAARAQAPPRPGDSLSPLRAPVSGPAFTAQPFSQSFARSCAPTTSSTPLAKQQRSGGEMEPGSRGLRNGALTWGAAGKAPWRRWPWSQTLQGCAPTHANLHAQLI